MFPFSVLPLQPGVPACVENSVDLLTSGPCRNLSDADTRGRDSKAFTSFSGSYQDHLIQPICSDSVGRVAIIQNSRTFL